MTTWQAWMACGLLTSLPAAAQADIFRWDNGGLIPGTQGITLGTGVNLSSPMGEWSSPQRNLRFAVLGWDAIVGSVDLTQANFSSSWLDNSTFNGANLNRANLSKASLTNADLVFTNLTDAELASANLTNANLEGATLTNANFAGAAVTGAKFRPGNAPFGEIIGTGITLPQLYSTASYQQRNLGGIGLGAHDLTSGDFSGQDLTGADLGSTLTNANFAGAVITGAAFYASTSGGFTKEQLYSTASYQQKNLRGIRPRFDLTSWDFSGQDLTGADFVSSSLSSTNLAGAVVAGANFGIDYRGGSGITLPQLYSTASYQQSDLRGIGLSGNNLTSGDLSGQDLTRADLSGSTLTNADLSGTNLTDAVLSNATLTNANLSGAVVTGARFFNTTSGGLTKEQLYSTTSYQQRNLRGIGLDSNNLTGWDFSGQDLSGAFLNISTWTNVNLAGAVVTGANFGGATSRGFTKQQLYFTASYQQRNLGSIGLAGNNLTGWDFSGQDLTGAGFNWSTLNSANFAGAVVAGARFDRDSANGGSGITLPQLYSTASYQQRDLRGIGLRNNNLTGGGFSGQDLTGADFFASTLTSANFTGAVVAGANFGRFSYPSAPGSGITLPQLYSTASYQQRNMRGIGLRNNNLTGGDFSGQDLAGAEFIDSQLTNANFSFADLRGAVVNTPGPSQLARNTIRESGAINGLDLKAGETLVVRDSDIGITVNYNMNAVSGGTLELVLSDADWGSTMAVAAGITLDLGGTLRVRFADQANLASMAGTTFDFFDWPAGLRPNNRFDSIELPPGTQWDFSQLYVTGTAQLTAIPEPSTALVVFVVSLVLAARCRPTHVRLQG